jgi:hypothetical protein
MLGALNFKKNVYNGDAIEPAIQQLSSLHNGYNPETIIGDRGSLGRPTVNGVTIVTLYGKIKGVVSKTVQTIKNF